ncbi:MAG: hypothetical protein J6O04_06390 [Selenomonadaceae bacterium]|nr:hypothetical protein [Selenomonadaceae bacterium]
MATSSITHNFFITDPAAVERFVKALDEAEEEKRNRKPKKPVGRELTNPEELANFAMRIKKQLKAADKI